MLLDVSSYNSRITADENAGEWHLAFGLLAGRRHNHSLPNVIVVSALVVRVHDDDDYGDDDADDDA